MLVPRTHTPHPHSCHHRCIEALGLHALVCDGSIRQRHTLSTMAVPELSEAARSHYEAALAKHAPSTEFRTGNARVTAWLHEDPPSQERLANVRVFYCDGTVWRCCCGAQLARTPRSGGTVLLSCLSAVRPLG